jgi:two-component system nitrogen regulation sensor histidine kinase NtrY
MNPDEPRPRRLSYESRILLLTLAGGAPAVVVAIWLLWTHNVPSRVLVTAVLVLVGCWLGLAFAVRRNVVFPLQTLSNLLACLREGDASLRARGARMGDAMGELMLEANNLAAIVREQRLDSREATVLLRQVMAEIDVAVFAFDATGRVRLVNRAGERLLGQSADAVLDAGAAELGLAACLDDESERLAPLTIPGSTGRWEVRRSAFRLGGRPHTLLVLTDVSRSLRGEERQAWQRLMRVLGHEINNSLAPIKSIAASLATLVTRSWGQDDVRDDMRRGLEVVATRAEALGRFTAAYSRLARLPQPRLRTVDLAPIVSRAIGLEVRLPVSIVVSPTTSVYADPDQIEQVLINLVKNAVDASLETSGGVRIRWSRTVGFVDILIEDEGAGLAQTTNLFVPFFTTKPGGSGVGLVISQQIAESHGGTLTLENRADRTGCVARLRLPTTGSVR